MSKLLSILICSSTLIVSAKTPMKNEDFYRKKMSKNIELASRWILEKGVYTFYEEGSDILSEILQDKWAVLLYVKSPGVDELDEIAFFPLEAKGIRYDIRCLHRIIVKEMVYEYWLFNIRGPDWYQNRHAEFYITKASNTQGVREVLHFSKKFFEKYQGDGFLIELPINDLKLLYKMEAWKYPKSYAGSDISQFEVSLDKSGYYIVGDSWFKKTGHLIRGLFGPKRSRYRK